MTNDCDDMLLSHAVNLCYTLATPWRRRVSRALDAPLTVGYREHSGTWRRDSE